MATRVFVPSFCDGTLVVFEKHKEAGVSGRFQAVLVLDAQADHVIERVAMTLNPADVAQCLFIAKKYLRYREAMSKAPLMDPVAQSAAPFDLTDPVTLMLIKNYADYKIAVYLFASTADAYLASAVRARFSPEFSLSLYRQAVALHDLSRIDRFLNEDWPVVQSTTLTRHFRECFGDTFFHMARMRKQNRLAFQALRLASRANPTLERAAPLRSLAAVLKESDEVLLQASIETNHGPLTPRTLAQVCVAQARLGQFEQANETLSRLRATNDPASRVDIEKVANFLTEQQRVQRK